MINFLEKITSNKDFSEKQNERIALLEKAVAELIFIVTEQQNIIQNITIVQDNLMSQILNSLNENSFLPEDLN